MALTIREQWLKIFEQFKPSQSGYPFPVADALLPHVVHYLSHIHGDPDSGIAGESMCIIVWVSVDRILS